MLLYGNSSFKFIYLTKYKLRIDLYKTVYTFVGAHYCIHLMTLQFYRMLKFYN